MAKVTKIAVKSVTDEIAKSIQQMALVGQALKASKLNRKAQVVLLQEAIGAKYITRAQIEYVLDELPHLEATYLNKGV